MCCWLVIDDPCKISDNCCNQDLEFRWAIIDWPVDWLCILVKSTTIKFVAVSIFMKKKTTFSLEFVSLRKKWITHYYSS